MNIESLQRLVIDALENVKAQDIRVFNTSHLTDQFDRVIIASGTSNRQTRSLANSVIDSAKKNHVQVLAHEGQETGEWVLVDLGDVIIHCMQPSIRQYYDLEELWGDKPVKVDLLPESTSPTIGDTFSHDFEDEDEDENN